MLGNLMKHEFKAVNRLMIPLHLGLIVITIVGRFYVQFVMTRQHVNYDNYSLRMWEGLMDFMLISAYVIALIAVFIITWLYLNVLRFRKNLFTDEGYLMHTLPVSAADHIISKLTVTAVWKLADGLLITLSILTMVLNKSVLQDLSRFWDEMWDSFSYAFGVSPNIGIPVFLIMSLVELISGILIIYMCITIGHSFNNHKILASIGIYVGYTTVMNMFSSIIVALSGIGSFGNSNMRNILFGVNYGLNIDSGTYFWLNVGYSTILSVIVGAAAFVLTNHFMSKRLNLE